MRMSDAKDIVEAARVDPLYYSFDGERHEALCVLASGQAWVFLSERGQRYQRAAGLRGGRGPDRALPRNAARSPGAAPGRERLQAGDEAADRSGAAGSRGVPW